jgi:hypothetical protein
MRGRSPSNPQRKAPFGSARWLPMRQKAASNGLSCRRRRSHCEMRPRTRLRSFSSPAPDRFASVACKSPLKAIVSITGAVHQSRSQLWQRHSVRVLPLLLGKSNKQFTRLLPSLQEDLEPVGTLEEVLVEKIAQEYWRLGVAARYEAQDLAQGSPFKRTAIERIFRYQTTINRQLFQAMNQLERLQRLRKGDNVPAPLALQVSHDTAAISGQENAEG